MGDIWFLDGWRISSENGIERVDKFTIVRGISNSGIPSTFARPRTYVRTFRKRKYPRGKKLCGRAGMRDAAQHKSESSKTR